MEQLLQCIHLCT